MFSNQCPSLERVPSSTTAANALLGMHDMIGKSIRYNGSDFCILGTGFHVGEPGFLVQGCPVRGCEDDECLRDPTYVNYAGMVRWCTSYLPNAPKEGLLKTRKSFKNAIYKKTLAHRRLMRARQAASEASAVVESDASEENVVVKSEDSEESEENVVVESEEDESMEEEEVVVKTESGQYEESDEEVTTTVTTTVETRVETRVETTVETIAVTSVATQTDA